jgi:hypothetical protein
MPSNCDKVQQTGWINCPPLPHTPWPPSTRTPVHPVPQDPPVGTDSTDSVESPRSNQRGRKPAQRNGDRATASSPRCRRSCLLSVPADGEAFPATTCTTNCQDPRKSAYGLGRACTQTHTPASRRCSGWAASKHARYTAPRWCVVLERRWLSHTAPITLGQRPLPPSTTPPAPMAPHAGMEAAPAAFTSPHPAHCACSSAAACQRQAGARWRRCAAVH